MTRTRRWGAPDRGFSWIAVSQVLGAVVAFVATVTVARLLPSDQYGGLATVLAGAQVAGSVGGFGLRHQFQRYSAKATSTSRVPGAFLAPVAGFSAIVGVGAAVVAGGAVLPTALLGMAQGSRKLVADWARAFENYPIAAVYSDGLTWIVLLISAGILLVARGLSAVELSLVAGALLMVTVLFAADGPWVRAPWAPGSWRELGLVAAVDVVFVVFSQIDVVTLSRVAAAPVVAEYAIIKRVAAVGLLPMVATTSYLYPKVASSVRSRGPRLGTRAWLGWSLGSTLVPLAGALAMSIRGDEVLRLVFGGTYGNLGGELVIMLIGIAVLTLGNIPSLALLVAGRRFAVLVSLIAGAVTTVIFIVGASDLRGFTVGSAAGAIVVTGSISTALLADRSSERT